MVRGRVDPVRAQSLALRSSKHSYTTAEMSFDMRSDISGPPGSASPVRPITRTAARTSTGPQVSKLLSTPERVEKSVQQRGSRIHKT